MENEKQTNKNLQADEIQALGAIFGDEFTVHNDNDFSIKIHNTCGKEFYLQFSLPESYPLHSPPKYEISAPWMKRKLKNILREELEKICCQYRGECVIYLWIDFIKDFIEQDCIRLESNQDSVTNGQDDLEKGENMSLKKVSDEIPTISHGKTITDRKSVFQAHLAQVVSVNQVNQVLEKLNESKKIATATHNMYAYRIKCCKTGMITQHCEDDGESRAGSVLLHLLETLHLTDILIVVTRWYGGIHLGADRFRHINDAAKNLINELGLIKDEKNGMSSTSRSK